MSSNSFWTIPSKNIFQEESCILLILFTVHTVHQSHMNKYQISALKTSLRAYIYEASILHKN